MILITTSFMMFIGSEIILSIICKYRKDKYYSVLTVWTLIYMLIVLYITIFSREQIEHSSVHLEVLRLVRKCFRLRPYGIKIRMRQLHNLIDPILNMILFMPFAAIAQRFGVNKKWIVVYGLFISLVIEVTQFITRLGGFEIDDLIYNTLGAIIGLGISILINRIMCAGVTSQ